MKTRQDNHLKDRLNAGTDSACRKKSSRLNFQSALTRSKDIDISYDVNIGSLDEANYILEEWAKKLYMHYILNIKNK